MITVPRTFAIATIEREGEPGRHWIDALPALVEQLCQQWHLTVDGPVLHGYLGIAVPVQSPQRPCILKVSWVDASHADEALALSTWRGQGAVQLLAHSPEQGALLLERLDYQHSLNEVEIVEAIHVAGRLLHRLAIPVSSGFRPLHRVAHDLRLTLLHRWERYGRPMSQRVVEHACELAMQFGTSTQNLLVNYDLHYLDVLKGERESWLAVDPKVVIGDLEFGIAQLLWSRLEDIEAQGGLDRHFPAVCESAQLDLDRAYAWTLVRCIDYWLWGISAGLTHDPARCEAIVNWLTIRMG